MSLGWIILWRRLEGLNWLASSDQYSFVRLCVHLQLTHDVKPLSLGDRGGLIEHTSVHLLGRKLPAHSRSAIIKSLVISLRASSLLTTLTVSCQ